MSYRYKNLTHQQHVIPGVGIAEPDAEFDSPIEIHNKNFQLINAQSPQKADKKEESPTLPKSA